MQFSGVALGRASHGLEVWGTPGSPGQTFRHLVQLNTLGLLVPPLGLQVRIPLSQSTAITFYIYKALFRYGVCNAVSSFVTTHRQTNFCLCVITLCICLSVCPHTMLVCLCVVTLCQSVCVSSHSVSEANRFASEASKCPADKEAPRRGQNLGPQGPEILVST